MRELSSSWQIPVVMSCGFLVFYSLPAEAGLFGRLFLMVAAQLAVGALFAAEFRETSDER